jgi:tRNA A-37 threonylcarbamoyl transferase component Bud32
MSDDNNPTAREERLQGLIAEYLQATEGGKAPSREELLAEHPDLADSLTGFFREHDRMHDQANKLLESDPAQASTLAPGEQTSSNHRFIRYFGDYELLEEIARGGMGVVYKARQVSLNRIVAVKMILAGQLASAEDVQRFHREAEAAANLDHPNIVPIYEVGEHDGQHYFSMKFIEGGSLASRKAPANGSQRQVAGLIATIARAVHHAHQRGILHRDLKPANVLIDGQRLPYVTDFGLAKRVQGESQATHSGAIVGTPGYMSPEQARSEKVLTIATDVYGLGAILYELLTGRPPFAANTPLDTVLQVLDHDPKPPRKLNPRVDRDLETVCLKCLQKEPAKRYGSALDLANDLDSWLAGEPTKARPPSLAGQAWRWLKRNAAATAGLVSLGLVSGLTAILIHSAALRFVTPLLYPPDMGLLNPLFWIRLAAENSAFRYGLLATAALLMLGCGWFVRLIARPRTPQAALAAAASVALVSTLVVFSYLGPVVGSGANKIDPSYPWETHDSWRLHPVRGPYELMGQGEKMTAEEEAYLTQYLPPEAQQFAGPNERKFGLWMLWASADATNRFYAAVLSGWTILLFVLVFFLGLALESTWAADLVARSGRGPIARAVCYLELYPPAAALFLWSLGALFRNVMAEMEDGTPWLAPPGYWGPVVLSLAFGTCLVTLAHVGVIRRWHPAARLAVYVVLIGAIFVCTYLRDMNRIVSGFVGAAAVVTGVCMASWPAWIILKIRDEDDEQPTAPSIVWLIRLGGIGLVIVGSLYAIFTGMPGAEDGFNIYHRK